MIVQVEARCWQYAHCEQEEGNPSRTWGSWRPLPPMPHGLSGGGSVVGGEQLWAVGGGDGETASGAVQILHLNSSSGSWEWSEGPSLTRPRYGHCVVQVMVGWIHVEGVQVAEGKVLVVGGHDDQGIVDNVELIDLSSGQVSSNYM